jgi:hypothetical protein
VPADQSWSALVKTGPASPPQLNVVPTTSFASQNILTHEELANLVLNCVNLGLRHELACRDLSFDFLGMGGSFVSPWLAR